LYADKILQDLFCMSSSPLLIIRIELYICFPLTYEVRIKQSMYFFPSPLSFEPAEVNWSDILREENDEKIFSTLDWS